MNTKTENVGLVIANIETGWALNVWPSFISTAINLGKNLFIFPGGRLNCTINSEYLRNPIYSLVNAGNLDGLIIWSSSIKFTESNEDFEHFHKRFDPLPYVTLASKIPGHPCVEFDSYIGLKQLITHSINVHGARKLAFIRGPEFHPYAQLRLKGFRDALEEAGLPVLRDDPLVTDPFNWDDGKKAAAQLFEERKLIPGKDFDTLIGCSDLMTLSAADYFSAQGYHMPADYHALGFDNSVESRITECPLSTVQAPFEELSIESFKQLFRILNQHGGNPAGDIFLPSKPIIRESCGCMDSYYEPDEFTRPAAARPELPAEEVLTAMVADYLSLDAKMTKIIAAPLIRAWADISPEDVSSGSTPVSIETFFRRFEKAMLRFCKSERDRELLLNLLKKFLRSGIVQESLKRKMEPALLWMILKNRERQIIQDRYKKDRWNRTLNSLKYELLGTRDRISLVQSLARHLPRIGIDTAGLVLYRDDATSLWVGSFSPSGISTVQEQPFPRQRLFPESLAEDFSRGIFLIQPLFIDDRSLGYFIHTIQGDDGVMFEELRSTISYALKGISLFEEVVRANQKIMEAGEQSRVLLLQKEAAQAASEAKTQFLAKVSHEIRTPMNAVMGMAELLLAENLNKRQRRYVNDIKISSVALLNIINQILDLSKIQSGKMNLTPIHYDFAALTDNISSMMRFLIKNKDIAFQAEMRGDVPKYLYGDDVRLRQILLNLLNNAVKFTKAGYVHLVITVTDTEIHFTVSDTGIGIREKDLPTLFEPFVQADEMKNREIKGTGLGLSITKALVEMMNGRIDVESEYGTGTTFHVAIPKIPGDKGKVHHAGPGERIVCSPDTKILVVDDNTINLNVVSGLLQLCNVSAFAATSGRQALE
ncbi:MAG: ATP-binding protein, partial [Treponema sp.]|nr:ATP-binding protein [Treponema sp.]